MKRIRKYAKNTVRVLLWIPVILLKLGLALLGLIIVPLALFTRRVTFVDDIKVDDHWPELFWLWGNDEEGCPEWWFTHAANVTVEESDKWYDKAMKKLIKMFPQWWWYAVRNPVNNFRFIFDDVEEYEQTTNWPVDLSMEARQLQIVGVRKAFRWRANGWLAGYRRVWLNKDGTYSEFWVGWKLGSIVPGLGFTFQWRPHRKVGT